MYKKIIIGVIILAIIIGSLAFITYQRNHLLFFKNFSCSSAEAQEIITEFTITDPKECLAEEVAFKTDYFPYKVEKIPYITIVHGPAIEGVDPGFDPMNSGGDDYSKDFFTIIKGKFIPISAKPRTWSDLLFWGSVNRFHCNFFQVALNEVFLIKIDDEYRWKAVVNDLRSTVDKLGNQCVVNGFQIQGFFDRPVAADLKVTYIKHVNVQSCNGAIECITFAALAENDFKQCEKAMHYLDRNSCYSALALKNLEPKQCDKINVDVSRKECSNAIQRYQEFQTQNKQFNLR